MHLPVPPVDADLWMGTLQNQLLVSVERHNKLKSEILHRRSGIFTLLRRSQVGILLLLLVVSCQPLAYSQRCLAALKHHPILLEEVAMLPLGTCPQPGHDGGDKQLHMAGRP